MSERICNHPYFIKRSRDGVIRKVVLRETKPFVKLDGLYLEFGVYQGMTINYIARLFPTQKIYGFDSWQGLPENWNQFPKGSYSTNGVIPEVPPNVELISGLFEDTLPEFIKDYPDTKTAFVHIDSDLYSSAKTIFKYFGHTFVHGTVIVFDEYAQDIGEKQAFAEWLEEAGLFAATIRITEEQASFIIFNQEEEIPRPHPHDWSIEP
jgi:hypothetical protein